MHIDSSYMDMYDRYLTEVNRDDVVDVMSEGVSGNVQKFMNYSINKVVGMIEA